MICKNLLHEFLFVNKNCWVLYLSRENKMNFDVTRASFIVFLSQAFGISVILPCFILQLFYVKQVHIFPLCKWCKFTRTFPLTTPLKCQSPSHVRHFATHGCTRLLCPWSSPGKSNGVGCHPLLQRLNIGLLHRRKILYHQGSPLSPTKQ